MSRYQTFKPFNVQTFVQTKYLTSLNSIRCDLYIKVPFPINLYTHCITVTCFLTPPSFFCCFLHVAYLYHFSGETRWGAVRHIEARCGAVRRGEAQWGATRHIEARWVAVALWLEHRTLNQENPV